MKSRQLFLVAAIIAVIVFEASLVGAANSPPLSEAWNIASTGRATSSGELLFRVTPGDGGDPVEVTVYVMTGTAESGVAGKIRRAFSTQLRRDRYNVEAGAGTNVLVTPHDGTAQFSVELMDSDVENVRVLVQSATPVATPTVPKQAIPANPPAQPSTPPARGDAAPPATAAPPANASEPAQPPPQNSPAMPNPTPPPDNGGPAGTPASAPPPR